MHAANGVRFDNPYAVGGRLGPSEAWFANWASISRRSGDGRLMLGVTDRVLSLSPP